MQIIIISALVVLLVVYLCVWLWGMWVAFTQGDDVVARFGRSVLSIFKRSSPSYWMAKDTIGHPVQIEKSPTKRPPDAGNSSQ